MAIAEEERTMAKEKLNWENFRQEGKTKKKRKPTKRKGTAEGKFAVGNLLFFTLLHSGVGR